MKLTATWNESDGEGRLSNADVKRLMEDPDIATVDFLKDVMNMVGKLYMEAMEKWHNGLTAHLPKSKDQD